jgi:Uri superfamily endonuclease
MRSTEASVARCAAFPRIPDSSQAARPTVGSPLALPTLRVSKGIYVLVFEVPTPLRLAVGKLGTFDFPNGWYAYAGSARGPGGLAARLGHHLHGATLPHWHVDYLRRDACLAEIWYGRAPDHDEHRWAACLAAMHGADSVAAGFGSSDCRCATHLIFFTARPNAAQFRRNVRSLQGKGRGAIYRISVGGN